MSSIGHCTGETQDDLLRIAIDLPEFWWIPKTGHIANYSKAESTVQSGMLHYSTTQFVNVSLCCYLIRHEIYLLRCSFFFEVFSSKQHKKCSHPKMTGQNDRQDESLTGQVRDQAGHCPFTWRYFQPCPNHLLLAIETSSLPTDSLRPLFKQIEIFSGILTVYFSCKYFP